MTTLALWIFAPCLMALLVSSESKRDRLVIREGEQFTLPCSLKWNGSRAIRWDLKSESGTTRIATFDGGIDTTFRSGFKLLCQNQSYCKLKKLKSGKDDSGIYTCWMKNVQDEEEEFRMTNEVEVIIKGPIKKTIWANLGEPVVLSCEHGINNLTRLAWDYTPTSEAKMGLLYHMETNITRGDNYKADCKPHQPSCHLTIRKANSESAGTYTCLTGESLEHENKFEKDQLTVFVEITLIVGELVCPENVKSLLLGENDCYGMEPDVMSLTCLFNYFGTIDENQISLKLTARQNSIFEQNLISSKKSHMGNNGKHIYSVQKNWTASLEMNGSIYECTLENSNINSCRFPETKINYLRNVTEISNQAYSRGYPDLECSANKSKDIPCRYQWIYGHDGKELNIRESDLISELYSRNEIRPGNYKCMAECNLGDKVCHVEARKFEVIKRNIFWSIIGRFQTDDYYIIFLIFLGSILLYCLKYAIKKMSLCCRKAKDCELRNIVTDSNISKSEVIDSDGSNLLPRTESSPSEKPIIICRKCDKIMKNPRILECTHTFCLECLENLKRSQCPSCLVYFKVPHGGMSCLRENKFIKCLTRILPCYSDSRTDDSTNQVFQPLLLQGQKQLADIRLALNDIEDGLNIIDGKLSQPQTPMGNVSEEDRKKFYDNSRRYYVTSCKVKALLASRLPSDVFYKLCNLESVRDMWKELEKHNADNGVEASSFNPTKDAVMMATAACNDNLSHDWYLDNGATNHITHTKENLANFKKFSTPHFLELANGAKLEVVGAGDLEMMVKNKKRRKIIFKGVWYVPKSKMNLISILKLLESYKGSIFQSTATKCTLRQNGKVFLTGFRCFEGGLFKIKRLHANMSQRHKSDDCKSQTQLSNLHETVDEVKIVKQPQKLVGVVNNQQPGLLPEAQKILIHDFCEEKKDKGSKIGTRNQRKISCFIVLKNKAMFSLTSNIMSIQNGFTQSIAEILYIGQCFNKNIVVWKYKAKFGAWNEHGIFVGHLLETYFDSSGFIIVCIPYKSADHGFPGVGKEKLCGIAHVTIT